jgi:outer membrane lipase/esterase
VISSGGNDVTYANISGTINQQAYLSAQANVLAAEIKILQSKGAQNIVVNGLLGSGGLATYYTSALLAALSAAGVNFIAADVEAFVQQIEANPTLYGFTAATVLPGVIGTGTAQLAFGPAAARSYRMGPVVRRYDDGKYPIRLP